MEYIVLRLLIKRNLKKKIFSILITFDLFNISALFVEERLKVEFPCDPFHDRANTGYITFTI